MRTVSELPVMISAAVGRGGETMISAQTMEAFWNAVKHVKPLSVGLNCSLGPDLMYPFLSELVGEGGRGDLVLSECGVAESAVGDGVRSGAGGYGAVSGRVCAGGLINIAGGCCGNTPEHIAAIAKALEGVAPRKWAANFTQRTLWTRVWALLRLRR